MFRINGIRVKISERNDLLSARMGTRTYFILLLTVFVSVFSSCRTASSALQAQENSLARVWAGLDLKSKHHTGLSIYDFNKGEWIFNYNEQNYFTPASTIKVLTMFAALHYLDKEIAAGYYRVKGDTLIVWGGGDPGTLYPDIHAESPFIDFLRRTDKTIVFSNAQFLTPRLGKGWAWDDFSYSYQCERTAFPIYGNRLWIDRNQDTITVIPHYFNQLLSIRPDSIEKAERNEWGNQYIYHYRPSLPESHLTVPIAFFENDMRLMWREALGKDIAMQDVPLIGSRLHINGSDRDSLVKVMMQQSDNFIAEQLLLNCSMQQTDKMDEKEMIEQILEGPLDDLPDSINWIDGSGLSRYNLLTPVSLVWVLRKMIKEHGLAYIKSFFPIGGETGTISLDYKGPKGQPYIFAKSGTLRNTYCLTGFLETKSGHTLLFAWMNNDFRGGNGPVKTGMEQFFKYLYDHQ